MLPDRVSNPGLLTYESGALPIALSSPAEIIFITSGLSCMSTDRYRYLLSICAGPRTAVVRAPDS